uniref:Uncharacterized protein n=1 Tax=Panagrolaimus sp. ES5 TaxID=591445 RepID=A0AC34GPS5_9BILA
MHDRGQYKDTFFIIEKGHLNSYKSWDDDQRKVLNEIKTPPSHILNCRTSEDCYSYGNDTGSTLSIHIAKYEAAVELFYSSDESSMKNVDTTKSRLKLKLLQKPPKEPETEYPRQQNDHVDRPEIMEFKASQRLLNPNTPVIKILNPSPTPSVQTRKRRHPDKIHANKRSENLPSPPPSTPPPPPPSNTSTITEKRYTAPSLPKQMTPQEVENFQFTEPSLQEWHKNFIEKNAQQSPPKETLEEEVIRLRKENINLQAENFNLKRENFTLKEDQKKMKNTYSSQLQREKKKKSENNSEQKNFEKYHPESQRKIINNIWRKLETKYGAENATNIVDTIHKRRVIQNNSSMTPLQTLQLMKRSGITISALREIRKMLNSFGVNNPFASVAAVNKERTKLHEKIKVIQKKVDMEGKNGEKIPTDVFTIESVLDECKDRLATLITSGNYEPFFYNGEEEVPFVISGDKAKDFTTLVMGIGCTKNPRNSPHNCSEIGYFKGNDSQSNLYAAFGDPGGIAEQVDAIKDIEIEIDGVLKKFKIRWFLLGDFKFLNAVAGLNSNSAAFPCWECEQKQETTYGELNLDVVASERTMGINKAVSQIREPLFKTIPYDQYIPPILHITLGPGAQLFEAICERARELDVAELEDKNIAEMLPSENARKSWQTIKQNIDYYKDQIDEFTFTKSLFEVEVGEVRHVCASRKCFVLESNIEIANIIDNNCYCNNCKEYFHKCCLYKEGCPHCCEKFPTLKQSQFVIDKERKDIEKKLKQTSKLLLEEEEKADSVISKFKLGRLAANVENVYEKYGGSRKAFFQEFTGKQLSKMGGNIHAIFHRLDKELQNDPQIQKIIRAIIQFFNIRKMLTTEILDDAEIYDIEESIKDFAEYMKENLPTFRVKQKGHVFFKHLPKFIKKFNIAGYFIDECIESYHVLKNKYLRRIGNRKGIKCAELLFKYNKEDTWLHDTLLLNL